jgi:flagellar biosynthesis protein FlhB
VTGPPVLDEAPPASDTLATAGLTDVGPDGRALASRGTEVAVAALVLSVLWLFFVGSFIGLALGLIARRRLAVDASGSASWAPKVALAAIVIGGVGTALALLLTLLQVLGVIDVTAACHPAVTGVTCRLIVR